MSATLNAHFDWGAPLHPEQDELELRARAAELERSARAELIDDLAPAVVVDLDSVDHDHLVPRTTRGRAEGGEQEAEGGEGAEDSLHAAHRTTAPERSRL
jgi:hypothetical protein